MDISSDQRNQSVSTPVSVITTLSLHPNACNTFIHVLYLVDDLVLFFRRLFPSALHSGLFLKKYFSR